MNVVMNEFTKGEREVFNCFTQDIVYSYRGYQEFHKQAEYIKTRLIAETVPPSPFVLMDGNCPLFYYWSIRPDNCVLMRKYGYLPPTVACQRGTSAIVPLIVQNFFKQHITYRKQVIENIERILRPYRESLIPAESRSRYPFRKYKNLITVHARFGAGGADFKDYRAFLTLNDSISFHNCLRLADRKNTSFIYLATDSSKLKEEFAHFYGNRLIMSTEQAQHSARDLNEDSIAGAISTVTDFTILTMGALFIGTPMSSYSSLSEMQGGFDPLRVVPTEKSCSFGSVYLPT